MASFTTLSLMNFWSSFWSYWFYFQRKVWRAFAFLKQQCTGSEKIFINIAWLFISKCFFRTGYWNIWRYWPRTSGSTFSITFFYLGTLRIKESLSLEFFREYEYHGISRFIDGLYAIDHKNKFSSACKIYADEISMKVEQQGEHSNENMQLI